MFAQINHMAMISPQWPMIAKFYEAMFGLKTSGKVSRPANGVSVGDGYVGLNINPLRDGYVGGLDHFGMKVDNVEAVLERMRKKFPQASIVKRPSTRPFADYSAADPDGNVFDLAQKTSKLNEDLCRSGGDRLDAGSLSQQIRHSHAACRKGRGFLSRSVRTRAPEQEALDARLSPDRRTRDALDPAMVDSDLRGHVDQTAGARPYRLQGRGYRDVQATCGGDRGIRSLSRADAARRQQGSDVRKKFLADNCAGKLQIADPGAVWIDITDE